jgi:hypothetical protein
MPRLSELPIGESVTSLFYGATGSGKTELVGTAGSRNGIVNCGLGIVTLQSPGFKKRHPGINPKVETVTEDVLPDNATGFDKVCDVMDQFMADDEIDIVSVDDVTALRRFALNKGLELNQKEDRSKSLTKSRAAGVVMKAVQDYGIEMDLVEQFVIHYASEAKRRNKHLIMTAHERIQYNKPATIGAAPTVDRIRPGFTGQTFPDAVTGHFDIVWYLEAIGSGLQVNYKANTAGGRSLVAKTRWSGLFPPEIWNPNFLNIVKKIREVT